MQSGLYEAVLVQSLVSGLVFHFQAASEQVLRNGKETTA